MIALPFRDLFVRQWRGGWDQHQFAMQLDDILYPQLWHQELCARKSPQFPSLSHRELHDYNLVVHVEDFTPESLQQERLSLLLLHSNLALCGILGNQPKILLTHGLG